MIEIPDELVATQIKYNGDAGRAFLEALPGRAAEFTERWGLRVTGAAMHGVASLALPVVRRDGTHAVLKLQLRDGESDGEWLALRTWDGDGVVRLLECDADTATLLLERLDGGRHLSVVEDDRAAVRILAELLARLTAVPAPATGLRRLGDIAAGMLDRVPGVVGALADVEERRLLRDCAAAVREVAAEPGGRLLHWDLHYGNILAAEREPWLAIDPKPLAGDPGFELLPALWNRFEPQATLWRFDLLTERLGLDRGRARAWTLGRVLQNSLWAVADGGGDGVLDERHVSIARNLLAR
ncbi:aminoglycoside phosphotransferase family protein [Streptomyces sp. NPDC002133]|uniref:aminoglycoside phosphotransferase family protein n=1 Tax=Streptomyces sp. NPDC002133 TaxID=3154409 RepID=UPI003324E730